MVFWIFTSRRIKSLFRRFVGMCLLRFQAGGRLGDMGEESSQLHRKRSVIVTNQNYGY
jgi:hypothetical protein